MRKLDIDSLVVNKGAPYPKPHDEPCREREGRRLALAAGLTQFGVNLMRIPPGAWSSQRHWHSAEDEFVYMLEGELVSVTNDGEEILREGDCIGFKAGVADGHHLQNRSGADAVFLAIGGRSNDDLCTYPDIDMLLQPGRYAGAGGYTHKDGTKY